MVWFKVCHVCCLWTKFGTFTWSLSLCFCNVYFRGFDPWFQATRFVRWTSCDWWCCTPCATRATATTTCRDWWRRSDAAVWLRNSEGSVFVCAVWQRPWLFLRAEPREIKRREVELGCHSWMDCLAAELFLNSYFSYTVTLFCRGVETATSEVHRLLRTGGVPTSLTLLFCWWLMVSLVFMGRSAGMGYS